VLGVKTPKKKKEEAITVALKLMYDMIKAESTCGPCWLIKLIAWCLLSWLRTCIIKEKASVY
jgi:hypothetical protein